MSKRSRKGVARNPPAVEIPWDQITEDMKCQFCHEGKTKDILQSGKLYKLISGKRIVIRTDSLSYNCSLQDEPPSSITISVVFSPLRASRPGRTKKVSMGSCSMISKKNSKEELPLSATSVRGPELPSNVGSKSCSPRFDEILNFLMF